MIKEISVDITNQCPFNCIHCSNEKITNPVEIQPTVFKRIIEYFIQKYRVAIIEFGGGEPFIHSHFFELIKMASAIEKKIIYTSGCIGINSITHISSEDADSLKKFDISQVNLSVYSHLEKEHNKMVQIDDGYSRVLKSISNLNQVGIKVCIHILITEKNYKGLFQTIEYLNCNFSIDSFRLLRFVPQGVGKQNADDLNLTNKPQLMKILSGLQSKFGSKITIGGYPHLIKCRPHDEITELCAAGVEFIHIMPDGIIVPCPSFKGLSHTRNYGFSLKKFQKSCNAWNRSNKKKCWRQDIINGDR